MFFGLRVLKTLFPLVGTVGARVGARCTPKGAERSGALEGFAESCARGLSWHNQPVEGETKSKLLGWNGTEWNERRVLNRIGRPSVGYNSRVVTNLDQVLYGWISRANGRGEDLDLPVGLNEDSLGLLKQVLGADYLEQLLIEEAEPVHFLDDEAIPLRKWLLSPTVDYSIIQTLEIAQYFSAFRNDPALADKARKLKHDRFWPMLFELAMASRVKRAAHRDFKVTLSAESADSVGDFMIRAAGYSIPCECSRLGNSPQITEPKALLESITHRISAGAKRIDTRLCVKIRSEKALTGNTYGEVLRLIRRCIADARHSRLPSEYNEDSTTVRFEVLNEGSEQIQVQNVNGKLFDLSDGDWDIATSVCRVPAGEPNELADRLAAGERFRDDEAVRLFMKFGQPENQLNHYERLTNRLKKKLNQTKVSNEHFGKIIFIEVPFDLRTVDEDSLGEAVRKAARHSGTTLAIVLAKREPNPHMRYHYCLLITFNQTGAKIKPEVVELFDRLTRNESAIDPILNAAYYRNWDEALLHAKQIEKPIPE